MTPTTENPENPENPDLPDLVAIKARMLAATPGDWQWEGVPDLTLGDEVLEGVDRFMITAFGDDNEQSIVLAAEPIGSRVGVSDADADFIAHAREDIATLLDEVVRLNDLLAKRPDQFFGQGVVLGVPPLPPPLTKPYLPGPDFIRKLNQDRNQNPRNNP